MGPIPLAAAGRAAIARLATALDLPDFSPGFVWLAGAGPGDAGLITALGLHAIATADVVIYDALVNPALLELARPDALRHFAGKRAGKPSPSQSEITARLIASARAGKRVLRLKGGDPFVFGRGGEEALALARARVAFRIVPGVTAGIGGLAYAGIPLTARATNHGVTFITGHDANGQLPDFDWHALARATPMLVAYMALRQAGSIAAALIAAGRDPATPAAIVASATTGNQLRRITTLAGLGAAAEGVSGPAMLVIGETVRLAEELDWLAALPADLPAVSAARN